MKLPIPFLLLPVASSVLSVPNAVGCFRVQNLCGYLICHYAANGNLYLIPAGQNGPALTYSGGTRNQRISPYCRGGEDYVGVEYSTDSSIIYYNIYILGGINGNPDGFTLAPSTMTCPTVHCLGGSSCAAAYNGDDSNNPARCSVSTNLIFRMCG